jgi:hypothetical protein
MTNGTQLVAVGRTLTGLRDRALGSSTRLAGAIVLRQALEQVLDEHWQRVAPALAATSMRNQLVALRVLVGDAAARDTAYVWYVLSDACHYDGYDLPPSADELLAMARMIDALEAELSRFGQAMS